MALSDRYAAQVALLVEVLPFVATEPDFALKGGTAINLFLRDLPRLSVDIDLTYLPVAGRLESLAGIHTAMTRLAARIRDGLAAARVTEVQLARESVTTKLTVQRRDAQIKVEVTPVLRGCIFPPELRRVTAAVEAKFGFASARIVSFPISMPASSSPRSIGSTRAICSTSAISWPRKASATIFAAPSSFISSAIPAPWGKSWRHGARTSPSTSHAPSSA